MSGHSKWKTIQHKKGAADAKRGKIFSRYSKELMVCARNGGGDPMMNASLRTIIQNAKAANMPMDNITRAIKKGTGELDGGQLEEITYEGYAAGGVGLIVQVLTDNKNRAAAEVRHVFTRNNSSFAQTGSVSRGFQRKGQITVSDEHVNEEKLMELVLEAGAEDMAHDDGVFEITMDPSAYNDVMQALENAEIPTESAEVALVPDTWVPVTEVSTAKAVLKFMEDLEDNDDVQNVYANFDMDDEVLAAVEKEG